MRLGRLGFGPPEGGTPSFLEGEADPLPVLLHFMLPRLKAPKGWTPTAGVRHGLMRRCVVDVAAKLDELIQALRR